VIENVSVIMKKVSEIDSTNVPSLNAVLLMKWKAIPEATLEYLDRIMECSTRV
jgi:hypothetical protein